MELHVAVWMIQSSCEVRICNCLLSPTCILLSKAFQWEVSVCELEAIPEIQQAARHRQTISTGCVNKHAFLPGTTFLIFYSFKEKNTGKKSQNMFSDTPLSKSFTFKCQTELKNLQVRPKFADFDSTFTALFCTCGTMLCAGSDEIALQFGDFFFFWS